MAAAFNRAHCERCGEEFTPPMFGETSRLCPRCEQELAQKPGQDDVPAEAVFPPTPITRALVIANVTVFAAMALAHVSPMRPTAEALIHWGGNFGPLTLLGEPWRLFSAMFLHAGLLHLALNMWVLWDLGRVLELVLGRWTFLATYLLCGLGSSVFSVWWRPVPVKVGASGAIFGVAGVLLAIAYLQSQQGAKEYLRHHLRSLGAFVMYNLIFGAVVPGIDNAGHVGGLLAGMVIGGGFTLGRGRPVTRYATFALTAALALGLFASAQVRHRAWIHMVIGHEHMERGEYATATSELQKAVLADPKLAEAYFDLGLVYFEQQDWEQAAGAFRKVVELEPSRAQAHLNLGMAYLELQRDQEAQEALKDAVRLAPRNAQARHLLGLALSNLGRYADAQRELETALELVPDSTAVQELLDDVRLRQQAGSPKKQQRLKP